MVDPITSAIIPALNGVTFDASHSSSEYSLKQCVGYACHFVWSGATSVSGDLVVEATNDDPTNTASPTFTPISTTTIATQSGTVMLNAERAMYGFVRVRWSRNAGSGGSLTAKICIKQE